MMLNGKNISMKQIYYMLMALLLLSGCYKDKGNYNYSEQKEVTIGIPFESYDVATGTMLMISPEIASEIDQDDLIYAWELGGYWKASDGYYSFAKFAEGKELACDFSKHVSSPGVYTIRLHVSQSSSGLDFYSELISIHLTSELTGLVVLHGANNECDIALLKAPEFLLNEGNMEVSLQAHLYSETNGGEKLAGVGRAIVQNVTENLYPEKVDRAYVVAITDQTGVMVNYDDFEKRGNWNDMFMPGINHGKPQFYSVCDGVCLAVDDGKIFPRLNSQYEVYPKPSDAVSDYYAVSPFYRVAGQLAEGFFFDGISRGFVVSTNFWSFYMLHFEAKDYFKQVVTSNCFNLANMQADLLYVDKGGQFEHYMAVMEDDGGNRFLAELDWTAEEDEKIPYARYDLTGLPDIGEAKYFAFGDNQASMCYYATSSSVYRYTAIRGEMIGSNYNRLQMEDGTPVAFDCEITMMKILKPYRVTDDGYGALSLDYYNYNKILLVGTYQGGSGKLYSLKINESTGDVISCTEFSGFDRIYDANIKGV